MKSPRFIRPLHALLLAPVLVLMQAAQLGAQTNGPTAAAPAPATSAPLTVIAGPEATLVSGSSLYLNGYAGYGQPAGANRKATNAPAAAGPAPVVGWSRLSGPGSVHFANPTNLHTTATFSKRGTYELQLAASACQTNLTSSLTVTVVPPPPARPLEEVAMGSYTIDNPLWNGRLKALVVNWIPYCYNKLSEPRLKEGGIDNFVEAGKKLSGQPAEKHIGPPWSDAYVLNTLEAMCYALMLDGQNDPQIQAAQDAIRAKLEEWIPLVVNAQEPDGYLQTRFTLATNSVSHWSARTRGEHEGYVAGYFIEAALAHYQLTHFRDERLYRAARRLADCWDNHLGPAPKQEWFDGHEEMELALIKLGRFVNAHEAKHQGDKYIALARFLLECRKNGTPQEQSHLPLLEQYEAHGHAVRAAYVYSAVSDIAQLSGEREYQSAALSFSDSIANRKYYVTGGIGSGETAEGFGPDYSLRNNSYCESCANCGELFLQHRLNLLTHQARYAALYEDSLYNAILGDIDLEGKNFWYQNPLDSFGFRYAWHRCPCCIGNIPRTLLELPTWMYAKDSANLYVNLFIGSSVDVGPINGTSVKAVQATSYPWDEKVTLTLTPVKPTRFGVNIRIPNHNASALYHTSPADSGLRGLKVNGVAVTAKASNGYVCLQRRWKAGDVIEFSLPLEVQRITASDKIAADRNKVALRYGPLIYNLEAVDQDITQVLQPGTVLTTEWRKDLLGGVLVIKGKFANGSDLLAIPNYARNNRSSDGSMVHAAVGESNKTGAHPAATSIIWIKER